MRFALAVLALISATTSIGQEGFTAAPPKELKALDWLKGTWKAEYEMTMPGSNTPTMMKGTVVIADALDGMYLETKGDSESGMKGYQLTSYDAAKKQYFGYWFDNGAPGALELWGTLKGQTLVMTSKPFSMPGMHDKVLFRSTHSLKGPGKVLYRIEMNSGKGWGKMMEGFMTK
jgi:hypothetical protein